jgi:hypothetical protein
MIHRNGELTEKYKMKLLPGVTLTGDQVVENFKRANRLTAQGSYLQAIGLFEEIITQYPGEYLPYVGYSIALEKTGLYGRSAWAVDAALKITENDPEQKDAKQFLDKRLSAIKSKSVTPQQDDVSVVKPAAASVAKATTDAYAEVWYRPIRALTRDSVFSVRINKCCGR